MPTSIHPYYIVYEPPPGLTASAATYWTIPALCAAYDWPTGLAGGGTIAIVELGGGWKQADVDAAFLTMKLPKPSIVDVSVDGTTNSPGNDADVEVALDIQVSAGAYSMATGEAANIRVYWAQDIAAAVEAAMRDGCDVCTISWGADEALWGKVAGLAMEAAAKAATDAGMVVFAASGDNDSSDGGPTPANVDLPAGCPHVVGCGGTHKPHTGMETVWNDNPGQANGEGTGGGYSTFFPVQPWQIGAPAASTGHLLASFGRRHPPRGAGRMVPDVCAAADPPTGYQIVVNGATQVVGGTSAVAPLLAGLFASFGKKLGWITPTLWKHQECFTDITQGNNGVYSATTGPDACSGIGSPIGTKLAALFVKP
jgi:kumamolisin